MTDPRKIIERDLAISRLSTDRPRRPMADCPYFYDHTPAPDGYLQWHAWAQRKSRTHKQVRCTGCRLYVIWVPRR